MHDERRVYIYTGIFILAGVGLALIAHIFHFERGSFSHAVTFLCETLGIAFIGLGIINFLIETKDWRNYFERRLQDIVVDQSYLKQLDKDRLAVLQTSVMKAFFKDHSIDREGSFLNYFHTHLHRFIAEPFRENVTSEIFFEAQGDVWKVYDKLSYRCRLAGDSIQKQVQWRPDEGEMEDVTSVCLTVLFPDNHVRAGQSVVLANSRDKPADREALAAGIPLAEYKEVDGLFVTLEAHYTVRRDRFQYWTMAHATKNFEVTLRYPVDHIVQVKSLVVDDDKMLTTQQAGYFRAKYESWVLPGSGLVWRILPDVPSEDGGGAN